MNKSKKFIAHKREKNVKHTLASSFLVAKRKLEETGETLGRELSIATIRCFKGCCFTTE